MKVWQKLSMIGAAFSLPIVVLLILVITGIDYHIRFAEAEIAGSEYQRPLEDLLQHLSEHRLLTHTIASGDRTRTGEIESTQLRLKQDFDALEAADHRL